MDAEHDLPAHAEDLDAAFAEAVADAGPHDQAEPHPAADLPLRAPEPASAPAAVDHLLVAAVDDRESATADQRQLAVRDVRRVQPRAWIGQVAGICVAAVGGAAIVLTMLVPNTANRDSAVVAPAVGGAVHTRARGALVERPFAAVETHERAAVTPMTAPAPAWRATDEWTGGRKKSMAYELAADRPVRLWLRQATPVLVVRCLAGTLDAFVVTGSPSAIEPGRTDHTVHLAMDDGQPETQHWTDSADHDGLFAPNGPAVFARLTSARSLRFTFTPHNAPPAEAVFHVRGADAFGPALVKHCRATK